MGLPFHAALCAVETDQSTPSTAHVKLPLVPTTSSKEKLTTGQDSFTPLLPVYQALYLTVSVCDQLVRTKASTFLNIFCWFYLRPTEEIPR